MSVISAPIVTHTSQRPTLIRPVLPSHIYQKSLSHNNIQNEVHRPVPNPAVRHKSRLLTRPSESDLWQSRQPLQAHAFIATKDDGYIQGPTIVAHRPHFPTHSRARIERDGHMIRQTSRELVTGATNRLHAEPCNAHPMDRSRLPPSPPLQTSHRHIQKVTTMSHRDDATLIWPPSPPDEKLIRQKGLLAADRLSKELPPPPREYMSPADDLFGFSHDWTAEPRSEQAHDHIAAPTMQQGVLSARDPNVSMSHRQDFSDVHDLARPWHAECTAALVSVPFMPTSVDSLDGSFAQRLRSKARSVVKRPGASVQRADARAQRSGSATEMNIGSGKKTVLKKSRSSSLDETDYELISDNEDAWF